MLLSQWSVEGVCVDLVRRLCVSLLFYFVWCLVFGVLVEENDGGWRAQ